MNPTSTLIPTSIRVFTHEDLADTSTLEMQVAALAAAHGFGVDVVSASTDSAEAIAAGVIALPAIVAYSGSLPIARRESAAAGRGTRRWFERKVASLRPTPTLVPAVA